MRQTRRLRELNRELAATIAEKEALIAEKDHLLREVNHRVQNSLQLVQAFLALQAREETPEVAKHLGEAQRRLSAVALVHRRLYQADRVESVDLARYLDDLMGDMRQAMGGEWDGTITADLAPILISADRAVNIGLVLTELIINAQKYAYAGQPGPIAISLEPYRNQFRLIVADQGMGQQREREGFGTRMIRAMVDRLGGTIERFDNRPGLRVILTAPSEGE
jgi:two-component sensor histidine kinase